MVCVRARAVLTLGSLYFILEVSFWLWICRDAQGRRGRGGGVVPTFVSAQRMGEKDEKLIGAKQSSRRCDSPATTGMCRLVFERSGAAAAAGGEVVPTFASAQRMGAKQRVKS